MHPLPLPQLPSPVAEATSLAKEAALWETGPSKLAMLPSLPVELPTQLVAAPTTPVVQPTILEAVAPKPVVKATQQRMGPCPLAPTPVQQLGQPPPT